MAESKPVAALSTYPSTPLNCPPIKIFPFLFNDKSRFITFGAQI